MFLFKYLLDISQEIVEYFSKVTSKFINSFQFQTESKIQAWILIVSFSACVFCFVLHSQFLLKNLLIDGVPNQSPTPHTSPVPCSPFRPTTVFLFLHSLAFCFSRTSPGLLIWMCSYDYVCEVVLDRKSWRLLDC